MAAFFKLAFINNIFKIKEVEGFEELQKRVSNKKEYLENILSYCKSLENSIKEVPEKIQNANKNFENIVCSPEEQNIHDSIKSIGQKTYEIFKENLILITQIIKHLSDHKEALSKELSIYAEFKRANRDLQEEKEKLNKNKEEYHKYGKKAETDLKQFIKNIPDPNDIYKNDILINDISNLVGNAKGAFDSYKSSLDKTNGLIKKYNAKQLILFNYFPDLSNLEGVFFFRLMKIYLQSLEKQSENLTKIINEIKTNEPKEIKTKLMELIEIAESKKKDETIQKFEHHQSELEFTKCQNNKEFELNCNIVNIFKNFIDYDYLFPHFEFVSELKIFKTRQLIKKLFKDSESEIDQKKAEELLDYVKDSVVYKGLFIVLSQLRTKAQFQKSKDLIVLLGKAFNIIIENVAKKKLYEHARNCMIISQTYYYKDKNNQKIYIFEYIKNNKYFKNSHFWRYFIQDMISKEISRFEKVFPDGNFNVEKNFNMTDKIKQKLNEAVFSQIITYASNMKDFEIDKRVILKIIDEFLEKYNFVSENNINTIYLMLTEGKDDIQNLRKDYDPSLEDELLYFEKNNKEENPKEIINKDNDKKENEDKNEENNEKENNIKENQNYQNNIINEEQKYNPNEIDEN